MMDGLTDLLMSLAVAMVGAVVAARVMLAVLEERLSNTIGRLERMERLLERLVQPLKGARK
jgi:hypothetical protein